MNEKIQKAKKILIVGDAGRGKTTLAAKLSEKLGILTHSTDDFFWEVKFSKPRDKQESVSQIAKVYESDEWIVEGSTSSLFSGGVEKADIIIYLKFANIFSQYRSLISRYNRREKETIGNLLALLLHITKKKYGVNCTTGKISEELTKTHVHKAVTLRSYKEIDRFIQSI